MLKTPVDMNYHCIFEVILIHKEFYIFVHKMGCNGTDNQRLEILLEMEMGKFKEGKTSKVKKKITRQSK